MRSRYDGFAECRSRMIYLVGGTTGSGKSSFGRLAAETVDIQHRPVDDVRMRTQHQEPASHPIRYFVDRPAADYLAEPIADLCLRQQTVATLTCVALAHDIDEAQRAGRDVLFEGDDILPAFVASWSAGAPLRAIFAVEDDPAMPLARERLPNGIAGELADTFAAVHRCHGMRVAIEARLFGFELVSPRDHDTWLRALSIE